MKNIKYILLLLLFSISSLSFSQNVGIGIENPDASALLDLTSDNKGLLIPRMDTEKRNKILNPANSLLIFNTDSECYEGYSATKDKWFSVSCLEEPATPLDPNPSFVCGGVLADSRDGNKYKTVRIGNQCWMAENLAYLPIVHNNAEFSLEGAAEKPGYGVYNYDGSDVVAAKKLPNYSAFGVYYNWYAVVDKPCPIGWHAPSDEEWCEMESYIESAIKCGGGAITDGWRGNPEKAGNKLKIASWVGVGVVGNGSDHYGFTALPRGFRYINGVFYNVGTHGYWWTVSEGSTNAFGRHLYSSDAGVYRYTPTKIDGFSLRCVKD